MRILTPLICLLVLAFASASATGGGTTIWETSTAGDFNAGTLEGVVVYPPGGVKPGASLARRELEEGVIMSLLDVPGRGMFVSTGRPGAVYRIDGDSMEKVLETEALMITALVAGGEGQVYAAAVPGGKIYRIPPEGEPSLILVPDPYIWAMTMDPLGNLLAATGPNGKLYRVEKGGAWVKEIFASDEEKNLVSLAVGGGGEVYCGSAENGLLYRVKPEGTVEAVHDFSEKEVRSITVTPEGLVVGVNTPGQGFDQVSFVGSLSGTLSSESWGSSDRRDVMQKISGAALYRIDHEERVEEVARLENTFLLDVGVSKDGRIFVATGDSGRVFAVDRQRRVMTVMDLDQEQVICLAMGDDGPTALGSGAPGVFYAVDPSGAGRGRYVSKILDAGFPAVWGRADGSGSGSFHLSFRTGRTEKPDRTWSAWSDPLTDASRPLPCPSGRYLQFRIDFDGDPDARIERVRVAYNVQNQRPLIKELNVGTSPKADTYPLFTGPQGKEVKIQIKAEDPNNDPLVFRLYYRQEGERWIPMTEDPLRETEYAWDTSDLPDGLYEVRLAVSDEMNNPTPLTAEKVSRPFPIDNHRPQVEGLAVVEGRVPQVRGVASDTGSLVTRIEYRVDMGPWQPLSPSDGVFDSGREAFSFSLPGLGSGIHRLWVRVYDRAGNVGVSMQELRAD